jgi:nicotinamide-nucleotide amidase
MSQKLEDVGLAVAWETTVGDDRESLGRAFLLAAERADAVIVNGGLGPTVDDLSQEIAAQAAGVPLVLNEEWLVKMEDFFKKRSRTMPPNNRKQAMLPATAEILDNPIGTACGFALDIGKARFFFTPGVPREMRRMVDEQVIPRLLKIAGIKVVTRLKRFHTFGIGESRADEMLAGIPGLAIDGEIKLGFQAHYPELETKLAARAEDEATLAAKLAPVEAEVRKRLGNFIVAEDDQSLESVVLAKLRAGGFSLAVAEGVTAGTLAGRLAARPEAPDVFKRGVVNLDLFKLPSAEDLRKDSGASHALRVAVQLDDGPERPDWGGTITIAIADAQGSVTRQARLIGVREWVRAGAVEMGLDCLRRRLGGLPVDERIDFERR